MQKSYGATRTQNMEYKYDWKETLTLEAETARIWKKVGLILERQGSQSVSGNAQQQQASDNYTPTKLTSCVASTHGQVRSPRKPRNGLELIWMLHVVRSTEIIRFKCIGIIGLKGFLDLSGI